MESLARSSIIPREKNKSSLCHACQLGRHVRLPFSSTNRVTTTPFQIIHCDLWTAHVESISGFKYYLVCLDDFTQYAWVYPLRFNSEVFSHLSSLHALALTQCSARLQAIQCDNGRESIILFSIRLPKTMEYHSAFHVHILRNKMVKLNALCVL